jgi:transposase-like protein
MTKREGKAEVIDIKGLLAQDADFVRAAVEALVQAALEAEMTEAPPRASAARHGTSACCRHPLSSCRRAKTEAMVERG